MKQSMLFVHKYSKVKYFINVFASGFPLIQELPGWREGFFQSVLFARIPAVVRPLKKRYNYQSPTRVSLAGELDRI